MLTVIRRRFRLLLVTVSLSLVCSTLVPAADDDVRTWSDTTGKFKIKAKLVGVEEGTVTLEKEDGSQLEIELKKLSQADQKFITDWQKNNADNPFKDKGKDPFKAKAKSAKPSETKPARGKPAADEEDEPSGGSGPRIVKVNWGTAQQIALSGPSGKWSGPAPADVAGFSDKPKTAALPNKSNFFEGIKGIAVSPVARKAAVGFVIDQPKPDGVSRIVLCDLTTGKSTPAATAPGQMVPVAVHDDGKQIVMRSEVWGFGNHDRMEVWTLRGTRVNRNVIWTPYDNEQGAARDVLWAAFVDGETLATSNRSGKVALWRFPEMEPICVFSTSDGSVPALSPDRKLIAYCTGDEIGLFDVAQQEVVCSQATPTKLQLATLAFSPSGKRLACMTHGGAWIWNTATGALEQTIPLTGLNVVTPVEFPDETAILANRNVLIDIASQLKLWTYDGAEFSQSVAGYTFFGVTEGDKKPGALVAARLPHPAAIDFLKKSQSDPSLWILRSGTTVKLNVSGISDGSQRERVAQWLTNRLKAIGCQAGTNGTIELAASVEGPTEREISYTFLGTARVKEYISRVKLIYQGQPAWETSIGNVPGIVSVKRGDSLESTLREFENPNYTFFERVELPKLLQKPSGGQGPRAGLTLGQSKLTTTAGLK